MLKKVWDYMKGTFKKLRSYYELEEKETGTKVVYHYPRTKVVDSSPSVVRPVSPPPASNVREEVEEQRNIMKRLDELRKIDLREQYKEWSSSCRQYDEIRSKLITV